jgi:hypothetical protein
MENNEAAERCAAKFTSFSETTRAKLDKGYIVENRTKVNKTAQV